MTTPISRELTLSWAPSACTLPTAERPLRVAEFDQLFETAVTTVEWPGPRHARLTLNGDNGLAATVRDLADRETACCSFFTFTVGEPAPGHVILDIEVPSAYIEVLTGLVDRADALRSR